MNTFNGDSALKARVLDAAAAFNHRIGKTDKWNGREKLFFTRRQWCPGQYVCQNGADCDHRFYADELGVPVAIAYAERAAFLELPERDARRWWKRFITAIPVGVDLDAAKVWKNFALYVLADSRHGLIKFAHDRHQYDAIKAIIDLYQAESTDAAAWEAAASAAIAEHRKSPYDNRRMEAPDAVVHAGCSACYSAYFFARAALDGRFASDAVSWSGWAVRYKVYAQFMDIIDDPNDEVKADERGMVNAFAAMRAATEWVHLSDEGDRSGEEKRQQHNVRVANRLIALIDDAAPRHPAHRFVRNLLRFR